MSNFNFQTGGYSSSGNSFSFPAPAGVSGTPYSFNFTEAGYVPSSDFNFGDLQVYYYSLGGTSNDFVAIWADPAASLTNGKMYASSAAAFSVVDLDGGSLYDYYTPSHAGEGGETLASGTVLDLNVV